MTFRVLKTRVAGVRSLLVATLLVTGCATTTPPVQEMSDARQAVQAARSLTSGRPAPSQLMEAEALLEQASEALTEGRYEDARHAALAAKRQAMRAREAATLTGEN